MDFIKSRKLKFKAWNKETKLLMRLSSIECAKGELFKKDHLLLQFTGLYDKQQEEIYELDTVLIGSEKFLVYWDSDRNGWSVIGIAEKDVSGLAVSSETFNEALRLCSYFELENKGV